MLFANAVAFLGVFWAISSPARASAVGGGCTITDYSQVTNVVNSCTNIVVKSFTVPGGKGLNMDLKKGTTLSFQGILTFAVNNWQGPLVFIRGEGVKIHGEAGSRFDGQGKYYWDGKGGHGSKKPLFFKFIGSDSEINNIKLQNCPERCSDIAGDFISVVGWNIDVSAAAKDGLGVNTDGLGISGHDISVRNSVVNNQDDCLVIGSGKNIFVQNIKCTGSHGLSLAVGIASGSSQDSYNFNTVTNVTFKDCTVYDADLAIHVKTVQDGGIGIIKDISYSNITMEGVRLVGIHVQQDYPNNDGKVKGNVPIKNLSIKNVRGTMTGKNSVPVRIACASGACSDFNWSGIDIKGNERPCSINYRPNGFNC